MTQKHSEYLPQVTIKTVHLNLTTKLGIILVLKVSKQVKVLYLS